MVNAKLFLKAYRKSDKIPQREQSLKQISNRYIFSDICKTSLFPTFLEIPFCFQYFETIHIKPLYITN